LQEIGDTHNLVALERFCEGHLVRYMVPYGHIVVALILFLAANILLSHTTFAPEEIGSYLRGPYVPPFTRLGFRSFGKVM
jgi:hypothetical protein